MEIESLDANELKIMETGERLKSLTPREFQILQLIFLDEYTNKQIAKELDITHRTVEHHRHKIMVKMDCKKMIRLAKILTIEAGWG